MFRLQTPYLKEPYFYKNMGFGEALVSILDPVQSRVHRAVVSPIFSTLSLNRSVTVIYKIIDNAGDIISERSALKLPVNIQNLYRCITVGAREALGLIV